jgi:hypothetical protein
LVARRAGHEMSEVPGAGHVFLPTWIVDNVRDELYSWVTGGG